MWKTWKGTLKSLPICSFNRVIISSIRVCTVIFRIPFSLGVFLSACDCGTPLTWFNFFRYHLTGRQWGNQSLTTQRSQPIRSMSTEWQPLMRLDPRNPACPPNLSLPNLPRVCRKIVWPSSWDMVLFILRKPILQTSMCTHPVGLDVWCLGGPFVYLHYSCMWTAKALAWAFAGRLCDKVP